MFLYKIKKQSLIFCLVFIYVHFILHENAAFLFICSIVNSRWDASLVLKKFKNIRCFLDCFWGVGSITKLVGRLCKAISNDS